MPGRPSRFLITHIPVPGTLQRRLVVVWAGQGGVQGKVP